MASLSYKFQQLLDNRKISRIEADPALTKSEFERARYDLQRAKGSFKDDDFKWATVQAYYCMFHVARGLIFAKGYREKSHRALLTALEELYSNELESAFTDDFRLCMKYREEADYEGSYSELNAQESIKSAESFLEKGEALALVK